MSEPAHGPSYAELQSIIADLERRLATVEAERDARDENAIKASASWWSLLTLIANYEPKFVWGGSNQDLVDEAARIIAHWQKRYVEENEELAEVEATLAATSAALAKATQLLGYIADGTMGDVAYSSRGSHERKLTKERMQELAREALAHLRQAATAALAGGDAVGGKG